MTAPLAVVPATLPALAEGLRDRLGEAGCQVAEAPEGDAPVGLLVVSLTPGLDRVETAERVFDLVERVRACRDATGALPRRVVAVLHPGAGIETSDRPHVSAETPGDLHHLAAELLRTLLVYLTAHTALDDTRINGVDIASSNPELERMGTDLILALASGMLDGVRGQLLRPATV